MRPAAQRPPVRKNQTLTYEELQREAAKAVAESGKRQVDLAESLGVTQGAISQALRRSGSKYSSLQSRIISHLTPFEVEEQVETTFRVLRQP
jgi:predicted transcriptional regulator